VGNRVDVRGPLKLPLDVPEPALGLEEVVGNQLAYVVSRTLILLLALTRPGVVFLRRRSVRSDRPPTDG
jgi:hypothetical protein